jgi:hypothetical protein
MNERIEKLALDAGLLNYVDNETPRRCFIHGHADLEEVEKFAELIVRECADIASINQHQYESVGKYVLEHFGVK